MTLLSVTINISPTTNITDSEVVVINMTSSTLSDSETSRIYEDQAIDTAKGVMQIYQVVIS